MTKSFGLLQKNLKYYAVSTHTMTLRIKCQQCDFNHISNIYRMGDHTFHKNFSNLESCPSCGHVSKCVESEYILN